MTVLLSTTYFGPVQWYQKLYRADAVIIDPDEPFLKQTYRNRCYIAAANGVQALTVPVEQPGNHCPVRDVRISDHGDWRRVHWNAIASAYGESPFFEYYQDDLRPFFERRWTFLYDFNFEIMQKVCELLDIHPHVEHTTEFHSPTTHTPLPTTHHPYWQVFAHKHGFQPNLSILDLLFCMGPESIFLL